MGKQIKEVQRTVFAINCVLEDTDMRVKGTIFITLLMVWLEQLNKADRARIGPHIQKSVDDGLKGKF